MLVITINKESYDPFIDFLKAFAIICVVISHALPKELYNSIMFSVYGGMAVPLFLMIQVFHAYKSGASPRIHKSKLLLRIILPFLFVQILLFAEELFFLELPITHLFCIMLVGGGFGPGAYYPWIYLQMTVLLVILWPILNRLSLKQLLIPFVIACEGLEIYSSCTRLTAWIYRLMVVRYIFLVYLGLIWVRKGVVLNNKTIIFSIVTVAITIFFHFNNENLQPWFYNTGWKTHRWICYFYASNLFIVGLWRIYQWCLKYQNLSRVMKTIARSSYEIFLVQMLVFVNLNYYLEVLIPNERRRFAILFLLAVPMSMILGIYVQKIMGFLLTNIKK